VAGPSLEIERGAERVLRAIEAASREGDDFASRLGAGIDAALATLAANPLTAGGMARASLLAGVPLFDLQPAWMERLVAMLRAAAAADPRVSRPPEFVDRYLVHGLWRLVAERIRHGGTTELPSLAPDLLECVLVFYALESQPGGRCRGASR